MRAQQLWIPMTNKIPAPSRLEQRELERLVRSLAGSPDLEIDRVTEALSQTLAIHPFSEQMVKRGRTSGSYWSVGLVLATLLEQGDSVLDFGCGAGGKPALAQALGFNATGVDDFGDSWHQDPTAMQQVRDFSTAAGHNLVELATQDIPEGPGEGYHLAMSNDVLEHQPNSPRSYLERLVEMLRPGGYLLSTVPNIANLRKRVELLRGNTNLPPFDEYYNTDGAWRGHIREYSRGDMERLSPLLGLEEVFLMGRDHMLQVLPTRVTEPYLAFTSVVRVKDSWLLVSRKPTNT